MSEWNSKLNFLLHSEHYLKAPCMYTIPNIVPLFLSSFTTLKIKGAPVKTLPRNKHAWYGKILAQFLRTRKTPAYASLYIKIHKIAAHCRKTLPVGWCAFDWGGELRTFPLSHWPHLVSRCILSSNSLNISDTTTIHTITSVCLTYCSCACQPSRWVLLA